MNKKFWKAAGGLCAGAAWVLTMSTASAQTPEVKEKPPMYTYVASWDIPRARWGDMEKGAAANQKTFDQAIAGGALVAYGDDTVAVHQSDGPTHDDWWSAMSMAGVLEALDSLSKGGTAPVLASATKHSDAIFVSRYYNWHPGTHKGALTHASSYKLKADAPDDAVDIVSKRFIVPLMEKLVADGTLVEYEVDEEAIHTESPDWFWVVYVCASASGLDKVNAALKETLKTNPLVGPAMGGLVDFSAHRDYLSHTNAVFK